MSQHNVVIRSIGVLGVLLTLVMHSPMLHAETQPPEGAVTATLGFPPVGATWSYTIRLRDRAAVAYLGEQATKEAIEAGVEFPEYFTVLEDSTYEGQPVHPVTDGRIIRLMDKATGNWIGLVRAHKTFTHDKATDERKATISAGEKLFSASPYIAGYAFPLWVGKSWQVPYTFSNHTHETTTEHVWQGKVTAYEDVTVPAGTFKAFKVEGRDSNFQLVSWYAPALHMDIKAIVEYLPGHALSPGQRIAELVKYTPK